MSIIVDPTAVPAEDTLTFNLLADDVGLEFDNLINGFEARLTVEGKPCGDRRTTYHDYHHPIIFELTIREEGIVYASAKLLVTRGSGYSYAFFAGGGWRACNDRKEHYIVQGATDAGFSSAYGVKAKKDVIGPGKIENALYTLASPDQLRWKMAFLHLCFTFIESVRLVEFGDFVRQTLVNGARMHQIHTHYENTPSNLVRQPSYWGQASNALREFYSSHPPMTRWNVSDTVLSVLGSTPAYEAESSAAAAIVNEEERRRAKILAEVNFCRSKVRIVMHGWLIG